MLISFRSVIERHCPAAKIKKANRGRARFQYSEWFRPFIRLFDDIINTDIEFFKHFNFCAEIQCFFVAQNKMDTPPCLYGLFENSHKPIKLSYLKPRIKLLNKFIKLVRDQLNSDLIKEAIRSREERSKENFLSCKELENKLFQKYCKLLVLRIDLAIKPKIVDLAHNDLTDFNKSDFHAPHQLEYLKSKIAQLLENRRSNKTLKRIVGYMIKFEHGIKKGFHAHLILFLDGSKYANDSYYADYITKYWTKLTDGKGCSYNCHRDKKKYRKLGIGLISYTEREKRDNLMICIEYLCKTEQFFLFNRLGSTNYKRLQKSQPPKIEAGKIGVGRPRKTLGCEGE